jgi:hypothetical protein
MQRLQHEISKLTMPLEGTPHAVYESCSVVLPDMDATSDAARALLAS